LDLPSLRQRERRWSTTRILRRQRIEPVVVEVVDHRPDPILRRERDLRDRRHVHPLRRPQHDLGPPPPHHRPRPAPHDRQQLAALIIRQITNLHPLRHPPSLRDPNHEVVDATPRTLPVRALAEARLFSEAEAAIKDAAVAVPLDPCVITTLNQIKDGKFGESCTRAAALVRIREFDAATQAIGAAKSVRPGARCERVRLATIREARARQFCAQGRALDRQGRLDDANKAYQSALALRPNHEGAGRTLERETAEWATGVESVISVGWRLLVLATLALVLLVIAVWIALTLLGHVVQFGYRHRLWNVAVVPRIRFNDFSGDGAP